ncbi:putative ferric-chelate reductase 1 isoform X2 [Nelusetta ayraudi]|uniref:putative ferric-chelate reductase 1 isoform X2 n=1 Tax=Nelusetta ayraudi TaxID=303726 RepID=UPI003F711CF9
MSPQTSPQMSPHTILLLLLMACGMFGEVCECFPNGSLALSCGDMMPYHPPFSPSTNSPPFTLSTSSATFRPGGIITVTLEVSGGVSAEFQGFMLQARSMEGNDPLWPVGKFCNINTTQFTPLHCRNMQNSTVSQASAAKRRRIQLSWEAPLSTNYREIYFSASVVQDYTTFWTQLKSSTLRLDSSGNSVAAVLSPLALLSISLLSLSACC